MPYETVKTEYRDKFYRDSVFMRDSVIVKEKGDTVYVEKYRYLYRDREKKDSVIINDTIREPYRVEVVKEINRLENWQIGLMLIGVLAVTAIVYMVYSKIKGWLAQRK